MTKKKYYTEAETTSYISFKLFSKNGKVVKDFKNAACFADIMNCSLNDWADDSDDLDKVIIYCPKKQIAYKIENIERWITDLNEIGFPCQFVDSSIALAQKSFLDKTIKQEYVKMAKHILDGSENVDTDKYNFEVKLSNYEYKLHYLSTFMLIRCLIEYKINEIPDMYFSMLDENPKADKFDLIQIAHKQDIFGGHSGHMITFHGNGGEYIPKFGKYSGGKNTTFEKFMMACKESKITNFGAGRPDINKKWCG